MAEKVTLLACTLELIGSNPGQETDTLRTNAEYL
jgi:hypothetical protein